MKKFSEFAKVEEVKIETEEITEVRQEGTWPVTGTTIRFKQNGFVGDIALWGDDEWNVNVLNPEKETVIDETTGFKNVVKLLKKQKLVIPAKSMDKLKLAALAINGLN